MILSTLWFSNHDYSFDASCANRSLHSKHANVICVKRLFVVKKCINCFFGQKLIFGELKNIVY